MSRKAWIIGASSGIGAALADELQKNNWQVVRSARSSGDIFIDVADDASVKKAAEEYLSSYGAFDLVVVMAGFWQQMGAKNFDLEVFKTHNNTNVVGLARCVEAVLPKMIAQDSGTFVGVSSVAGFRGLGGSAGYGPSKAGQLNLLESLRVDLHKTNVRVLSVAPGFVETPMTSVNKFPMPFIIKADRAAKFITDGMERATPEIVFPPKMALAMKIAKLVPPRIWPKLFRKG
jgi:short-subunit dehydrogenase